MGPAHHVKPGWGHAVPGADIKTVSTRTAAENLRASGKGRGLRTEWFIWFVWKITSRTGPHHTQGLLYMCSLRTEKASKASAHLSPWRSVRLGDWVGKRIPRKDANPGSFNELSWETTPDKGSCPMGRWLLSNIIEENVSKQQCTSRVGSFHPMDISLLKITYMAGGQTCRITHSRDTPIYEEWSLFQQNEPIQEAGTDGNIHQYPLSAVKASWRSPPLMPPEASSPRGCSQQHNQGVVWGRGCRGRLLGDSQALYPNPELHRGYQYPVLLSQISGATADTIRKQTTRVLSKRVGATKHPATNKHGARECSQGAAGITGWLLLRGDASVTTKRNSENASRHTLPFVLFHQHLAVITKYPRSSFTSP